MFTRRYHGLVLTIPRLGTNSTTAWYKLYQAVVLCRSCGLGEKPYCGFTNGKADYLVRENLRLRPKSWVTVGYVLLLISGVLLWRS